MCSGSANSGGARHDWPDGDPSIAMASVPLTVEAEAPLNLAAREGVTGNGRFGAGDNMMKSLRSSAFLLEGDAGASSRGGGAGIASRGSGAAFSTLIWVGMR